MWLLACEILKNIAYYLIRKLVSNYFFIIIMKTNWNRLLHDSINTSIFLFLNYGDAILPKISALFIIFKWYSYQKSFYVSLQPTIIHIKTSISTISMKLRRNFTFSILCITPPSNLQVKYPFTSRTQRYNIISRREHTLFFASTPEAPNIQRDKKNRKNWRKNF